MIAKKIGPDNDIKILNYSVILINAFGESFVFS